MKKYNYKGKNAVEVKVIVFHSLPDFVLEKGIYFIEGALKGLVKSGVVNLRDVEKVIEGTMSQSEFSKLQAWEG